MDEKILIKGEKGDIKKTRNIFFIIGAALLAVATLFFSPIFEELADGDFVGVFFLILEGAIIFALPFFVFGIVIYFLFDKVELTVTDKRVYGRTAFGKRVDLPLDSVSAIGMGMFSSIAVTTSSGAIKFAMMKNRNDIHEIMSKLLVERQNKTAQVTEKPASVGSNADELKKYKDLLDAGVITQEEFEAKKKQILGL